MSHAHDRSLRNYLCASVRPEPLEGTSQESGNRMRRMDAIGSNDQETTQQLKQAKLAIAELYQENRELRQQLAMKIMKESSTRGHEGNTMAQKTAPGSTGYDCTVA
jgi:hypothetical protein